MDNSSSVPTGGGRVLFDKPTINKLPWWKQPGLLRGKRQMDMYRPYPSNNHEYHCGDIQEVFENMDTVFFSIDFESLCLEKAYGDYRTQPIIEVGISVLDMRNIATCTNTHIAPTTPVKTAAVAEAPGCFPGPTAATAVTSATPAKPVKTAAAAEAPGCFPGPTAAVGRLPCHSNPGDRGLLWRQHIKSDHYIVDEYNDHYAGNCSDRIVWTHNTNAYGFAFKSSKFVKEAGLGQLIKAR